MALLLLCVAIRIARLYLKTALHPNIPPKDHEVYHILTVLRIVRSVWGVCRVPASKYIRGGVQCDVVRCGTVPLGAELQPGSRASPAVGAREYDADVVGRHDPGREPTERGRCRPDARPTPIRVHDLGRGVYRRQKARVAIVPIYDIEQEGWIVI